MNKFSLIPHTPYKGTPLQLGGISKYLIKRVMSALIPYPWITGTVISFRECVK